MLEMVEGLRCEDLLARLAKPGSGSARGPCIVLPADSSQDGLLLAGLRDGEKLHVVGCGGANEISGDSPEGLVERLAMLGLRPVIRLKQIHLIADCAGKDGERSFAARFDAALRTNGFQVNEIKAPTGPVRCDSAGKIWILSGGEWVPSNAELNYYTGPAVQWKHRK